MNLKKTEEHKFEGFDYLRAIFSIAIVADHTGLFLLATFLGISALTDVLYANFSYVAVPVFFQISLFLFYLKNEKLGLQYFIQKRLSKLVSLYLFWVFVKVLCDLFINNENWVIKVATSSVRGLLEMIVSGGNSPFYFFFSLLFITILAKIFILLSSKFKGLLGKTQINYFLLFISCILIFSFSIIGLITTNDPSDKQMTFLSVFSSIAQWNYNPLNFLPYIFTAAIVVQELKEGKLRSITPQFRFKLYILAALFLIFTLLEWYGLKNLLQYSRLSLVFSSWLLLYLALLSTRKPAAIITFISNCSLGLYAFHLLFTHVLFSDSKSILGTLAQISPGLEILIEFFIALAGSIVLTLVFQKTKWVKNFV